MADPVNSPQPKPDYTLIFSEGISLIFNRWTAVQMAVSNGWGGRFSHRKLDRLASDVLSFFTKSKYSIVKDDLANFLSSNVLESFNTVLQDESHQEVADELLNLHKDLLCGSLKSIEKLRTKPSARAAVSRSNAMVTETDDSSSDEDCDDNSSDDGTSLEDDRHHNIKETGEGGDSDMAIDEEGWSVVSSRRNKGKSFRVLQFKNSASPLAYMLLVDRGEGEKLLKSSLPGAYCGSGWGTFCELWGFLVKS